MKASIMFFPNELKTNHKTGKIPIYMMLRTAKQVRPSSLFIHYLLIEYFFRYSRGVKPLICLN